MQLEGYARGSPHAAQWVLANLGLEPPSLAWAPPSCPEPTAPGTLCQQQPASRGRRQLTPAAGGYGPKLTSRPGVPAACGMRWEQRQPGHGPSVPATPGSWPLFAEPLEDLGGGGGDGDAAAVGDDAAAAGTGTDDLRWVSHGRGQLHHRLMPLSSQPGWRSARADGKDSPHTKMATTGDGLKQN